MGKQGIMVEGPFWGWLSIGHGCGMVHDNWPARATFARSSHVHHEQTNIFLLNIHNHPLTFAVSPPPTTFIQPLQPSWHMPTTPATTKQDCDTIPPATVTK